MSEVGPRAEAGRGVQLGAKRSAAEASGPAQQQTGHQGSIVEAEAAQRWTDVTRRLFGTSTRRMLPRTAAFNPAAQTQLFRSFWHASPDGSSGALGDDSQDSPGAVSDPCKIQI